MDSHTPLSDEKRRLLEMRLRGSSGIGRNVQAIPKRTANQTAPLSAAQHQMWLLDQMKPGVAAYNIPVAYRIAGALDVGVLEAGFNEIIRRHEAWRTTFREFNGEPVQQIHEAYPFKITVTDFSGLPATEREQHVRLRAAEDTVRPFDLAQLPLLRVSLFRIADDDHVLLVTVHHIVADGLSLGLMFDELDAHYRSTISGSPASLPPITAQYSGFAEWEMAESSGTKHAGQLDHWMGRLHGELPVLALATDHARPPRQSFRGSHVRFTIPATVAQALTVLGTQQRSTFFTIAWAALQLLLIRHGGGEQILIGTPFANRPLPELQRLLGNFLNMVTLRCDASGNPSFIEFLQRCRESLLTTFSNADVPFETVVKNLKSARDPSRNPVFQVLMQVLPLMRARLGDLRVSRFDFELRFSQVDVALHLFEEIDGGFFGQFQFCTDLFSRETIDRLAENFTHLLTEIVRAPHQRILQIPILPPSETHRVLHEWNQTAADFPREATLHALIAEQAQRTPDAVAVEFEGARLTHRELDRRANQLANRLRKLGVGSGVLVGISTERSLELLIGLLGILKAGGAYVPIDPDYPEERRVFMLSDAAVPVLLTQRRLAGNLPPHHAHVICLDTDWADVAQESELAPSHTATAEDLAYMIYTSGSTGRPKGALNHHRGIVNRLLWMQSRYRLSEADAVLQKTPFSFDVSVWEFFWPLLTGARLVVARPGGHQDPAYLVRTIKERGINVMHFVPPMLRVFLEEPGVSDCTGLRHVICSGEALPHDLQEKFFERLPCELHNLYGPTEAAVDVTHWTCVRGSKSTTVPIGRPVANTQCYILDAFLQPAPIGVPGELHLGGVQIGRGYHKRPELTAEKFIADPFSNEPRALLYKTGDLCRWLPDGTIEYLGRIDHQVKIRGFRIELGEIESALMQHESVRESVVIAREDTPGDKRIVAYVACAPQCSAEMLREHLRMRLPDYMLPSAFVLLDALPLNANGKVDRRSLPAPDFQSGKTRDFVEPRTELEARIARTWHDVLKIPRIGIHDNFFELGGDSLRAMQIVGRLRGPDCPNLNVFEIFERPTIAEFAAGLTGHVQNEQREEGVL